MKHCKYSGSYAATHGWSEGRLDGIPAVKKAIEQYLVKTRVQFNTANHVISAVGNTASLMLHNFFSAKLTAGASFMQHRHHTLQSFSPTVFTTLQNSH